MKILLLALALALPTFAADVAGKWKASAEGPNGAMTRTFDFKVDGEKLTGETVSSFAGKSTITNGTIKGDTLSFVITISIQGNEMTAKYTGKVVSAGEIKLTAEIGETTIEWLAKRE